MQTRSQWVLTKNQGNTMGGLFSTPSAPVQSNEAQLLLVQEQTRQNDLLYAQQQQTMTEQAEADDAAAENLRMIEVRDAEAQAEADEREARAAKGKKDLLYRSALGVENEDESGSLLKLGGDV